jgi:hypothetical protein
MRIKKGMRVAVLGSIVLAAGSSAGAQLLPGGPLGGIGRVTERALGTANEIVRRTSEELRSTAASLARDRLNRLQRLVRASGGILEMSEVGPAVRGEVLAVDPSPDVLGAAERAGFIVTGEETIVELGIRAVTLRPPANLSLQKSIARLRRIAPDGEFTPNHIHLPSGAAAQPVAASAASERGKFGAPLIGIIDGGAAAHPSLSGVEQRGFVMGAPAPSEHGTAVASLAVGKGFVRGAVPGAPLLVADVYGRDPRGGNALAISRALGFMAQRRVKVIAMSLVGPPNSLVARAIGEAMARGIHVVAAVGNDGPAAPPAFPASYDGVIAVTGVDGRNRPLIEAGRSLHLDFAAPGADMAAASASGGIRAVRGTSYAVPLVAGRIARSTLADVRAAATDLGRRGPDKTFGYGLVCGDCRTRPPKI